MATATKAPKAAQKKPAPAAQKAKAVNPILEAFPTAKQVKVKGVEEPYYQIPASEIMAYFEKAKMISLVRALHNEPTVPMAEVIS